jgi:hypothetical protein
MRWQLARRAGLALAGTVLGVAGLQAGHASTAGAATTPSVVAVSRLQNLIDTVRGNTHAYAGLWIDDKTGTVYVSATSASVTPAAVAALEPTATRGAATMPLKVVHGKYSFAQLTAIAGRVASDAALRAAAAASHAVLSEWYPDPITDKVVIGFTTVTPAERAAVRARYSATARVIAAPTGTLAIGTGQRRGLLRPAYSRSSDSSPWYGGDEIDFTRNGKSYSCTSGFRFGASTMSTAGHCGANPTSFTNSGAFYGKTYTTQYGDNRIDMQLLNGSSYDSIIWAGTDGITPEPVSGSGGVAQGGRYCTDGITSLENCSAVVNAIDVCVTLSNNETGGSAYECDQDQAASNNGTCIFQGGDSGGPVFTWNSVNDPFAVGTVTGESNSGCTSGWWSDMYMEKQIFGSSPAVG